MVQVVDSWANEHVNLDANSDSFITTNDVLQIINDLNENGGRRLPVGHQGATFFDVNRDGHATAIDALVLINFLSRTIHGSAEGEVSANALTDPADESPSLVGDADPTTDGLLILLAQDQLSNGQETTLSSPFDDPADASLTELSRVLRKKRLR